MSAEPKEMPLEQPTPPSTKDAGAQGSGEASPARSAPRRGFALKTKTTLKRVKKPSPVSQEEDEAGDSGDASPARYPLPDGAADADHNKRAVTPKHEAPEGEQEAQKITEQDHAGDTSPPHDKDMHNAHGEEQQEKEVANPEHADDTSPPKDNHSAEEEQQGDGIPQQKDGETGAQVNSKALQGVNALSTMRHSYETEKKPAVEQSWSYDDELKILNALVVHAQSHNGALPDSSHLLANLTFDKIDATEDKLTDKIRKLRKWYCKFRLQGCPSDDLSRQLFKLSEILWGQVDEDELVEPTSRDFSVLSKLFPHLAKEVKAYAETHSSGDLIMAMFMTIGDEKARELDAKCKKQHIEAFKLELGQASLSNELLSALPSLSTKITDPSQTTPCKRMADRLKEPLDEHYLRHSKRVAGKTEGFKDKANADEVFTLQPKATGNGPNSKFPAPHLTKNIVEGIATGFQVPADSS